MSEPVEQYPLPKSPIVAAPRAPTDTPSVRLTRKQWIGLPVLVLVPLLALFGVFGDRQRTIAVSSPSLGITINYPERMRYRQSEILEISVLNRGQRVLDTVLVSVDTSYLSRFIDVRSTPSPTMDFSVPLVAVQPGEARLLSIELTGDRYWRHPATVSAATGPERTTVTFSTLVFP
jgi:hypothetical protein